MSTDLQGIELQNNGKKLHSFDAFGHRAEAVGWKYNRTCKRAGDSIESRGALGENQSQCGQSGAAPFRCW
jgi:hypothetical protein